MRKMARYGLAALLVALLLAQALPGAQIAAAEGGRPVLNVFIEEQPTVEDFETNLCTLYIQDLLDIELDFIIAPVGTAAEKMNILINSGSYPDVFYRSVPNENLYGVESGILIDLTDYLADYAPNFMAAMELRPTLLSASRAVDGKLYALPGYSECYHCKFGDKMWYNTANLEALGLDVPQTIDQFYDALVAYKAARPDGIPLTGGTGYIFTFLTNMFTYSPSNPYGLRLVDEQVETMIDDEEYREALRFMHKLFEEGLLYEGTFTMDGTQLKALLASEGEPVLFVGMNHNVHFINAADSPVLYSHTLALAPLEGPEGARYVTYGPAQPTPQFAVSVACEHPEKAVQFADFHYSAEGFAVTNYGPISEGGWRWGEAGETYLDGGPAILVVTAQYDTSVQNYKWEPRVMNWQTPETGAGVLNVGAFDWADPAHGSKVRFLETLNKYAPYYQDQYQSLPGLKFTGDEEEEMASMLVNLQNHIAQSRVAFITGEQNLDSDWDAYVAGLESIGMQTIVDYYQVAYDRSK